MLRRRRRGEEDDAPIIDDRPAESDEPVPQGDRLTPVEIQQKVFRLSFRGYNERDVDEFLDRVTEEIATLHEENERLREAVQDAGGAPAALGGAQRQAEDVVRQAREHAARLVEEAERRAASIGAGAPSPADAGPATIPSTFISRERDFLKSLAGMVQDHARALKEEVREARSATAEPGPVVADEGVDQPEPAAAEHAASVPPPAAEIERPEIAQASEPEDAGQPAEPKAAWGPARAEPEAGAPSAWREETRERPPDSDPLVSAWESAFGPSVEEPKPEAKPGETSEQKTESGERPPEDRERRRPESDEPSLKELFWGEQ